MNRTVELLISCLVLILITPLVVLISLAIVLESPGYPFFLQERVGRMGRRFQIIKFRKMRARESDDGIGVTIRNDPRLTRVGRWLERFKLDELPQFINVLNGDMAIVGPRPELAKFTKFYPEKWEKVLSVQPGILGYAQTVHPIESDLYPATCTDPETFYLESILPDKLDLEIEYTRRKSFVFDFLILLKVARLCFLNARNSFAYCFTLLS